MINITTTFKNGSIELESRVPNMGGTMTIRKNDPAGDLEGNVEASEMNIKLSPDDFRTLTQLFAMFS